MGPPSPPPPGRGSYRTPGFGPKWTPESDSWVPESDSWPKLANRTPESDSWLNRTPGLLNRTPGHLNRTPEGIPESGVLYGPPSQKSSIEYQEAFMQYQEALVDYRERLCNTMIFYSTSAYMIFKNTLNILFLVLIWFWDMLYAAFCVEKSFLA